MSFDYDLNEARRAALADRSNVGPVGLQWAYKAPRDWKITTLQRLFTVSSGDFLSPGDLQEDGFPVFGGNGFRGYFRDANCNPNTMLIGRYGALCGNVHIPPEPFWATEHAFRVRPLIEYHQPFVARYVEALELRHLAARAAQPGLNSRMVREQAIALPTLTTQRRIADFLDRETARIDLLTEQQQRSISVLREYRAALITGAVTGQVPVVDQVQGIEPLAKSHPKSHPHALEHPA
ncbi:MAG: restriction endonuclease subunit S [Rhodobacteraceae bacterium]|nr:restriction endonuclease subunit S [Paracoccaceae bacterium]